MGVRLTSLSFVGTKGIVAEMVASSTIVCCRSVLHYMYFQELCVAVRVRGSEGC